MINSNISGLHHVTALSSGAQENLNFYAGILGLRMVKKTINFDAPDVYHLYYGDGDGSPGTLMTFFPYPGITRGRKGTGQLTVTSFSVPEGSLDYWMKRLDRFNIEFEGPGKRFDKEEYIYFEDGDGLGIELVAGADDSRDGYQHGPIPGEHAIKGFHGVTLNHQRHDRTEGFVTGFLDYKLTGEDNGRKRYSTEDRTGGFLDIVINENGTIGRQGSGTVHHVAFATADDLSQMEVRGRLEKNGVHVTPVIDRQYFKSIYFREPGGILFEVATVPPGMAVDEEPGHLGEVLRLPPWQEKNRAAIEDNLGAIRLDIEKFRD
jgi:glyoxalase family protein